MHVPTVAASPSLENDRKVQGFTLIDPVFQRDDTRVQGFTLIELLVVIAIIAILAVVVVLTLNPAEMMREARDSNRLSDLATLQSAINLYSTDAAVGAASGTLGNQNIVYVSLPDPTLTGNQTSTCASLNLPALPAGDTYQCSSPNAYRTTSGSGWLPVNLSSLSSGSPIASLPVDPTNASSTGLYYTYATNGSQYMVTAIPEGQKQKLALGNNPLVPDFPDLMAAGTNLTVSPLYDSQGLVGYWPLNEGSGTIAIDQSGNGNNGTWAGTQAGTSGYYSAGNNQSYAGYFDGSTDYVNVATSSNLPTADFTIAAWVNRSSSCNGGSYCNVFATNYIRMDTVPNSSQINFASALGGSLNPSGLTNETYDFLVGEIAGTAASFYVNGQLVASGTMNVTTTVVARIGMDGLSGIGGYDPFPGTIQNVRFYNRALSSAEIMALYNAGK